MKKKILLVNPHIEDFAAYDHFSKPLGLLYLASYLADSFDLHFINALTRLHPSLKGMKFRPDGTGHFYHTFIPKPRAVWDIPRRFKRYGLPDEVFLDTLKNMDFRPDYIFVTSVMTYWYTGLRYTISLLRQVFPGTPVILGGIYASLMTEHALKESGADSVIGVQRISNTLREIAELTGTEIPAAEYREPFYSLMGEFYYAPVYTSLGCIYRCNYCASGLLNTFIQFPPERVAETILSLRRNYGVRNFAFYDDALLVDAETHIDRILRRLADTGFDGRFYTPNGLHIRHLTGETAKLMRITGFEDIRLSLESNDPGFQKSQGAKTTNIEFENAVDLLLKNGFKRKNIQAYTLLNTPGLDAENTETAMKYIHDCGAVPRLAYYSPIPGTPDYALAEKVTPLDDPLFHNNNVYLYRSGFDIKTLERLKALEIGYRRESEREC